MKKFQFLFGALAISAALMIMTEAKASARSQASDCVPFPNDACFVDFDEFGEPIYLFDHSDILPDPF